MDILTLSLAVKKVMEKLGVKDTTKTISNKGLSGGVDYFYTGTLFAKVPGEPLDLSSFTKVINIFDDLGIYTEDVTHLVQTTDMEGLQLLVRTDAEDGIAPIAFSANTDVVDENGTVYVEKGTYIAIDETQSAIMEITLGTIHPIDPKYLPGVCLPMVELTTEITETNVILTAEESAKLEAAANMNLPCVIKCVALGQAITGAFFLTGDGETPYFMFALGVATVTISRLNDELWEAIAGVG